MSDRRFRLILALILLIAATARCAAAIWWNSFVERRAAEERASDAAKSDQDGPFFFGDSDSYWKLGRAIAKGERYEFDTERHWQVFRTPGYPALLAPIFLIFGDDPPVWSARALGVALGTVNSGLVAWLALALFPGRRAGRWIALLASGYAAVEPTLILQSVCVLSEEPFLTFALLLEIALLAAFRSLGLLPAPDEEKKSPAPKCSLARLGLLIGLLSALAVYFRPSWHYFVPFAFLFTVAGSLMTRVVARERVALPSDCTARNLCRLFLPAAVVFALALSPWVARNYALAGKFIPTSLQMGASLYDGLNPRATGASDMYFVDDFRAEETNDPKADADVFFEVRLDERMKRAAIAWAKDHPKDVLRLAVVKFARLWAPVPREKAFDRPVLKLGLALSWTPVLILSILGALRAFRRQNCSWFLLAVPAYITCLHVIFVSSIRYRAPAVPLLGILAAYLVVSVLEERRSRLAR